MNPCPLCGSTANTKYDTTSDWCVPCTTTEAVEQRRLRYAPERHQIIAQ